MRYQLIVRLYRQSAGCTLVACLILNTLLLRCQLQLTQGVCFQMFTEQDRKCTYNATSEARSDTSYVKLMTGMAATSLPWQLHDALVIGVEDRAILKKRVFVQSIRCL